MTMIGVYAVVSKESNEVVASFVTHSGQSLPKNINNLTLNYVEDDKVVGTETVFLSSNKGNIDKLEALQREHGNQLCVIDGKGFGYDSDIVLLTNTYNPDYS
ncbi:hypothetical protein ACTOJ1_001190 [Shigella flexneri]